MTQEEIKLVREYDRLRTDRSLTDDLEAMQSINDRMTAITKELEQLRIDSHVPKPKEWRPLK